MVDRFERFSFAISEISRCWHKIAADEMEKYGLKGSHAIYLTTLYRYSQGVTAAKLSELSGKDKADVSRMTAIMEKNGLIVKEGSSYRALLKLTEEGRTVAEHINSKASAAVEIASRGLPAEKRAVFYEALELITANLQTLSKEGLPSDGKETEND